MHIFVEDIAIELVTSTVVLVASRVDPSAMGTGDEVDTNVVLSEGSLGSDGCLEVPVGAGVLLGLTLGLQMEATSAGGGGVTVVLVDEVASVSLVVEVFSDVTAGDPLVNPMGASVGVWTVVVLGTASGPNGVVLVVMATGVVRKTRSNPLSVETGTEVVRVDVDGTTGTAVVPVIGVVVGIPGVVKLEVAVEELVSVVALMVVLLVVVTSGGELVGDVTLGVVEVSVAAVIFVVVVVVGVAVKVDATRVVKCSWCCIVVEVVGVCGDQEGG